MNKRININKIYKQRETLQQELNREPTREELIELLDDPALKEDVDHLHTIIRLDASRTEDGEATLHEVLEDDSGPSREERFKHFEAELKTIMYGFPEREKQILFLYYGIGTENNRAYNLREIGEKLDLTRERIRQIKEHTLEKIKNRPEGQDLLDYF